MSVFRKGPSPIERLVSEWELAYVPDVQSVVYDVGNIETRGRNIGKPIIREEPADYQH